MDNRADIQQEQPQFQAPKKEKKGMGKRVLSIILILILLAVTAAGAWYYGMMQGEDKATARTSETQADADRMVDTATAIPYYEKSTEIPTGWKMYSNSRYGISLHYPKDAEINNYVISKKDGDQNVYSENADEVIVIGVASPGAQQSRYQINIQKQTLEDTISQLKRYYEGPGKFDGSISYVTYQYQGGYQLVEVATDQSGVGTTKQYFTYKNGYTYALGEVADLENQQNLNSNESLIIFESIIVD